MTLTREQIVAISNAAMRKTQQPGFAQTPANPKHAKRLAELKAARGDEAGA